MQTSDDSEQHETERDRRRSKLHVSETLLSLWDAAVLIAPRLASLTALCKR
jgi:hypothetical protein